MIRTAFNVLFGPLVAAALVWLTLNRASAWFGSNVANIVGVLILAFVTFRFVTTRKALWLDHLFFGHGRGMRGPHFDSKFYWLGGHLYSWMGGFGAQLVTREWFHPVAGTRRTLNRREYVIFSSHRRWLRVETTWAIVGGCTIESLRALKAELDDL